MGFLAEFYSEINQIYQEIKPLAAKFVDCFQGFAESNEASKSISIFSEYEQAFSTPQSRLALCNKFKEFI